MNLINVENYFLDEVGQVCCEGTVNGIYFQAILDGQSIDLKLEGTDSMLSPEVIEPFRTTMQQVYFQAMTSPIEEA